MELFYKAVFGVILAITLSSQVLGAPSPSKLPSRVELLVTAVLAPRVTNATEEVRYRCSPGPGCSKQFNANPALKVNEV